MSQGTASRTRAVRRCLLAALLAASLALPARAAAVGLQPIGTFASPIFVTADPGDPDRIFVVQRGGVIRLVQGGSSTTFADLTSVVRCCQGEQGLLSMALPPDFPQTGLFYVDYVGNDGPGNIHVAELRANGDSAPISTLRNVLTIPHPATTQNHNGGQLQFGPDGELYISTGDGGATHTTAQNHNSLLGKILRIDPRQSGGNAYSIPAGNPFAGGGGAPEVWAYGFRNPWRFSFDRQTGDLLIGDVGETAYEEVDYAPASSGLGPGANYGWDCREGLHAAPAGISGLDPACPGLSGYTNPIFEYTHAGGNCAITGGYVVRDPSLGDLLGRYLYGDYCVGQIRSIVPGLPAASGDRYEGVTLSSLVSFGEDSCGRLYAVEQASKRLPPHRLRHPCLHRAHGLGPRPRPRQGHRPGDQVPRRLHPGLPGAANREAAQTPRQALRISRLAPRLQRPPRLHGVDDPGPPRRGEVHRPPSHPAAAGRRRPQGAARIDRRCCGSGPSPARAGVTTRRGCGVAAGRSPSSA